MIPSLCSRPLLLAGILFLSPITGAFETTPAPVVGEEIQKPGVTLQWLTEFDRILRGETLTVGLSIRHEEGFHTYWRSPGIVGLAPKIKWDLPEGVSAGPILWPGPELTKMGKITAWGYERDVLLLVEITISTDFAGTDLPLAGEMSWMACAKTCHPGSTKFSLTVPIGSSYRNQENRDRFTRARQELPAELPTDWKFSLAKKAVKDGDTTIATLEAPVSLDPKGVVFFCGDNQVNSDSPQSIRSSPTGLELKFPFSEFAPENPDHFDGVLYQPKGWPGLGNRWLRVTAVDRDD